MVSMTQAGTGPESPREKTAMATEQHAATPHDSRFIPFTQQAWCCVPTSIQMVMYRHGIPLLPVEEIGFHNVKEWVVQQKQGESGNNALLLRRNNVVSTYTLRM